MLKQYFLYLIRWQLSTPILAVVLIVMSAYDKWTATIVANLIGGLMFFWIDKLIFATRIIEPLWEIKENINCADCGKACKGFRLVKTPNYDRITDKNPEFRCEECSKKKLEDLRKKGVKIRK